MRRLPNVLQVPLTLLTGKPYTGQQRISLSVSFHVVGAVASMSVGFSMVAIALTLGGPWTLTAVLGMAVTLHGMRNARMMVLHQAAHKNLYRRARTDQLLGQACSVILLVQSFSQYSSEHTGEHHSRHHMTLRDPTVQAFLIGLGLAPGMSRREMWTRVLAKLCSPWFHTVFAVSRLRSFWSGANRGERIGAIVFHGSVVAAVSVTDSWLVFLLGWVVPLFPLFQVSNTLRLCVKHTFPTANDEPLTGKDRMAGLTNAIFIGESVPRVQPTRIAAFWAWTRWTMRMFFVHLPVRYLVLTGDTVCHDFHHRFPRHKAWFDYISERALDSMSPKGGWPAYTEVWGLAHAISHVFDSLSNADPKTFDRSKIGGVSTRALFAAFDD
ncbi:stearoyl-CoA 9-desaturase [Rhodococcus sp. 1R11]|nr:stearoyl-CoA 9-desaturase [Rhodococcus sp. 1R11]